MNRDGRDDAADIDRAFADIMSRWDQTAHRDEPRSRATEAPAGSDSETRTDAPADAPPDPRTDAPTDAAADTVGDTPEDTPADTPDSGKAPGEPTRAADELRDEPAPATKEPNRPRTVEEVFGSARDTGWRVHTPPEENDEFVPPRPAPPSGQDVTFWLALIGIVGGPLWIIYLALATPHTSRLWFVLAIAATLGGFGLMVMRLPARREPEDDDDDGAVV